MTVELLDKKLAEIEKSLEQTVARVNYLMGRRDEIKSMLETLRELPKDAPKDA